MKNTFIDKLKEIMSERNLNQSELANLTNISPSSISDWLNGRYIPKQDKIDMIAQALKVSPAYLMGWEEEEILPPSIYRVKLKKVPKLGSTAAGIPLSCEYADEYEDIDQSVLCDFCLDVKGNSMAPTVEDGDIVFLKKQPIVNNGEIAVIMLDGEATLKRFYKTPNEISLISLNPTYPPIVIHPFDYGTIEIIGLAVYFKRKL